MNRTLIATVLIATVLPVCLVSGFGISQASADELKGLISVTQESAPSGAEALAKADELIARRGGGGGVRRGGGGVRRGGGARRGGAVRRSGGMRQGGNRMATTRRAGGSNVRRSNGGRSGVHRSNTNHSQHASNSRSSNANHNSQNGNSKGSNKTGKNSQANRGDHGYSRDGRRGGWDGGAWASGGWDGRGWDGGAIFPIDPIVPVVPVDPVYVGPRPVITLLNPAGTGASLSYTLGAAQYVIAAGETATFEDGTQEIAFDRGRSFGEAHYTLLPGAAYKFVSTDHGWDLHSVTAVAGTDSTNPTTAQADTSKSTGASALTLVSGN